MYVIYYPHIFEFFLHQAHNKSRVYRIFLSDDPFHFYVLVKVDLSFQYNMILDLRDFIQVLEMHHPYQSFLFHIEGTCQPNILCQYCIKQ